MELELALVYTDQAQTQTLLSLDVSTRDNGIQMHVHIEQL